MTSRADPAYAKPTPRPSGSECVGAHRCNYHASGGPDAWCSFLIFTGMNTLGPPEAFAAIRKGGRSGCVATHTARDLMRTSEAALAFVAEVARDKCTIAPSSEAGASALGACSSSICYPCRARRVLS